MLYNNYFFFIFFDITILYGSGGIKKSSLLIHEAPPAIGLFILFMRSSKLTIFLKNSLVCINGLLMLLVSQDEWHVTPLFLYFPVNEDFSCFEFIYVMLEAVFIV